jgi:hypothetical protein
VDYVDKPPKGQAFGIRSYSTSIPFPTPYDKRKAQTDPNAWVGVPTGIKEVDPSSLTVQGPGTRRTKDRPTIKFTR